MPQERVSRWVQGSIHAPQAVVGRVYRPRQPRATALYQRAARHAPEQKAGGRFARHLEASVIERFLAYGGFTAPPPIPRKLLEPWFGKGVLALLRREGLVADALAERMCAWRHTGFSVHNAVAASSWRMPGIIRRGRGSI